MILTADQVVQVATILLPGFIALKVLYVFGFQSKRTDLEWAVWSLLASLAVSPLTAGLARQAGSGDPATFASQVQGCVAPIVATDRPPGEQTEAIVACASSALAAHSQTPIYFGVATLVGIALGGLLVLAWKVVTNFAPRLGSTVGRTAWDRYTARPVAPYVEITLGDDRRLSGLLKETASTVEVDEPDVYITDPAWFDDASGDWVAADGAEGVWLPYGQIKRLVFMKPVRAAPAE